MNEQKPEGLDEMLDGIDESQDKREAEAPGDWNVLAQRIHASACERGFWDDNPGDTIRGRLSLLCLINTETAEAAEVWICGQGAKALSLEQADIAIRILDMAAGCKIDIDHALKLAAVADRVPPDASYFERLFHITVAISNAAQASRKDQPDEFVTWMGFALQRVIHTTEWLKLDLSTAIMEKMAYNAERPYMHGALA